MPTGPFPAIEPSPTSSRVLGIESSCDETAAAVVEDGRAILSTVVASQVDLHAKYGGVFPEVASRQHILAIYPIVEQALLQAHLSLHDVDAIAVTRGPGLPGSLVIGMNAAKGLALGTIRPSGALPLIGINHLEAHLYSAWLKHPGEELQSDPQFPVVALIVSGGHTELVLISDHLHYQRLGSTLDDAAGEAFDKVSRLIGLGYPGGPAIQKAAEGGDPQAFNFPRSWLEGTWNFSFSGLKTAVLREVRRMEASKITLPVANLAASFQSAVAEVLVVKTMKAAQIHKAQSILVVGGVSANRALRDAVKAGADRLLAPCPVYIPPISLCTDNAAMVAAAGHFRYIAGQRDDLNMDVLPNWPLSEV